MKNQEIVLEFVFKSSKTTLDVREIAQGTGLKYMQVHQAIWSLRRRGFIKSETIKREIIGFKKPPIEKILIRINPIKIKMIKWVLERAKNGEQ